MAEVCMTGSSDVLVTYTMFPDVWPKAKTERADVPWQDLTGRIINAATYIDKAHCPLISMAEYGEARSSGGILRHAENVRRIFGIELDYDGENMPLTLAAQRLQAANLQAILYTSPSHKPMRPRWRVLMPLSEPATPEKRAEYVGRANRVLGGIASRESFTLSQSFYIGRVRGATYETAETHGRCIDMAADIEPMYFVGRGQDGESQRDATTDEQLRAAFDRGEDRYQAMLKLSARWAARGMAVDDIAASLEALFGNGPSLNGDGIDLRDRARPMAESAVRKFGESRSYYDAPPPSDEPKPAPLQAEAPLIEAREFIWADAASIPPRPWLYSKHYMRGMVSATAGVGGAGKSTVLLVEAIGMAIGRDLLHGGTEIATGPLRVWVHNGEDPYEELQRRVAAIAQHYGITREDLGGRFSLTSGRDMPILVAEALSDGGKVFVPRDDGRLLVEECQRKKIDVFVADPFVTLHRISENDNTMIDAVMTILRNIAHTAGIAFEVAHHLRKLNGLEASVDDVRGASSIIGACRSVRLVATMAEAEATKYGIPGDERRTYFWMQNGKANMLPPTHARHWMQMTSVDLGNACHPYPADHIGVAAGWTPPDAQYDLTPAEFRAVRLAIVRAPVPLNNLRADIRATGWVGHLIGQALELDTKDSTVRNQVTGLIERWVKSGRLAVDELHDPKKGRRANVVRWVDSEDL
jgi:hypothetical protein